MAGDKGEIAPFLLKKDAEAYAAKIRGKVLGFDEAVKTAVERRLSVESMALRHERQPTAEPQSAVQLSPLRADAADAPADAGW